MTSKNLTPPNLSKPYFNPQSFRQVCRYRVDFIILSILNFSTSSESLTTSQTIPPSPLDKKNRCVIFHNALIYYILNTTLQPYKIFDEPIVEI